MNSVKLRNAEIRPRFGVTPKTPSLEGPLAFLAIDYQAMRPIAFATAAVS